MQIHFVVMAIYHWVNLQGLGLPLASEQMAPGCVGFLPVFQDFENAEAWRDGNNPKADIIAIRRTEEVQQEFWSQYDEDCTS